MEKQPTHLATLAAIADRYPDRTAVHDEAGAVSYAGLAAEAARVARELVAAGVGRGDRVGVLGTRDASTVAAIHGVLGSGAAYVPVDTDWPTERRLTVLRDCAVGAVVGGDTGLSALGEHAGAPAIRVQRSALAERAGRAWRANWPPPADRDGADSAYLLYTSGSTGAPKGVVVSHAAARAFVDWAVGEFAVTERDVLAMHASFSFDISTFALFGAAMVGATLVLVPPFLSGFPADLADFVAAHEITVWYSVPFPLAGLAGLGDRAGGRLESLRAILFAGDVFPPGQLAALMAMTPQAVHANLYGPTETNVCTFWRVTQPPSEAVPIGRAIPGDTCWVQLDGRRADKIGSVGELWAAGATLADGYWRRPTATAERFVPVPGVAGGRAYRTGDLVRIVAPGTFEYLGRRDHQVKVRGVRVELGEIDTAAMAAEGVSEACAVTLPDPRLGRRLYLVVAPAQVATDEIRQTCRERLPPAAVPEEVLALTSLPRTPNGKIDRSAVQSMALRLLSEETAHANPDP